MNLFKGRRNAPPERDIDAILERIRDDYDRRVFYLHVARGLVQLAKEFVVRSPEIDADGFSSSMDRLGEQFAAEAPVPSLAAVFEKHKDLIIAFARRQHRYLTDREQELRDIIELLGRAMAALDSDNQSFHKNIYAQSEKVERLTELDDIRKIKASLRDEVLLMQRLVADKQQRDADQMRQLNRQIDSLHSELARVRDESLIDGLTGAFNRKGFDARLVQCVEADTLRPAPFALLMIDIDDFKRINDTYGHPVGDRVLVSIVEKCRQIIREGDFLARYGGEEFALILPGASLRSAAKRARQICKAVAATRYQIDPDEAAARLSLTVSIGVSVLHRGDTTASLTDRADRALYKAKHSGKNRVCTETELDSK